MKAVYIYPEDIGAEGQFDPLWIKFCAKLGLSGWHFCVRLTVDMPE